MNNSTSIGQWLSHCNLPRIDAAVLVTHVTGISSVAQFTHPEKTLLDEQLSELDSLKQRRLAGEPLAYIIGEQEFFSLPFRVNPHVLIPRPDTECLVEWLIDHIPTGCSLVDLGTGSGCIAISVASKRSDLSVFASDIDPEAIKIAQLNADLLKVKVSFSVGSWLQAFPKDKTFDVVVSNPPYIRPDDEHLPNLRFEPIGALSDGIDGLECYRQILKQVSSLPHRPDILAFEHGWDQAQDVQILLEEYGFEHSTTHKDYGGNNRFTSWTSDL